MQIFWHGFSCVRIESSNGDQEATLVLDPYASDGGLRFPRSLTPDIVGLSHQDKSRFPLDVFANQPFLISDPGEYEVKGVFAYAIALPKSVHAHPSPLMYRFEIEGISLGYLGGLNRLLAEEELGRLENIDILFMPVGGVNDLTTKQAVETITEIEPRMVVPLNFQIEGVQEKLVTIEAFCKEMGPCKRENLSKIKLAKKDLPGEDMVIAVLERA